jgi:four helix bundle protein
MAQKSYEDLIVWQRSIELVTTVYENTRSFPKDELYGLTSQMRRSAVSIPSNIAEGQGRATPGEFRQFLCHARGSLYELRAQWKIAERLGFINAGAYRDLISRTDEVGKLLHGLLRSLNESRLKGE